MKPNEKDKYEIFQRRIKTYNNENNRYTHYVDLCDGTIMVIIWNRNYWDYEIFNLEVEKRRDGN